MFYFAGVVVTPFRAAEYYLTSRHRDVAWKSKIIKGIIVRARIVSCGRARICRMIKTGSMHYPNLLNNQQYIG